MEDKNCGFDCIHKKDGVCEINEQACGRYGKCGFHEKCNHCGNMENCKNNRAVRAKEAAEQ